MLCVTFRDNINNDSTEIETPSVYDEEGRNQDLSFLDSSDF